LPEVCLFVAAYNEAEYVVAKVENSFQLNYPKEKLTMLGITDGSDDGTPDIFRQVPNVRVEHQPDRR